MILQESVPTKLLVVEGLFNDTLLHKSGGDDFSRCKRQQKKHTRVWVSDMLRFLYAK